MFRRLFALSIILALSLSGSAHIHADMLLLGAGKKPSTATPVTWNALDKDASISLSPDKLTATGPSDPFAGVRATASASSGKKYWEIHADTINSLISTSTGFGLATTSLSFPAGFDTGVSWLASGAIYVNGVNVTNKNTWAQGDTLCIALNISTNELWIRVNGGDWNLNGASNPATGVDPIDISTRGAGALFPIATAGRLGASGNDVFTANFGATPYAQTPPAGYGNFP